jgi:hypothetical protein
MGFRFFKAFVWCCTPMTFRFKLLHDAFDHFLKFAGIHKKPAICNFVITV